MTAIPQEPGTALTDEQIERVIVGIGRIDMFPFRRVGTMECESVECRVFTKAEFLKAARALLAAKQEPPTPAGPMGEPVLWQWKIKTAAVWLESSKLWHDRIVAGWGDGQYEARALAAVPQPSPEGGERDSHRGGNSYEASMLRNLLARIHGDGGHYVEEHGLDKALEDADSLVANWRAEGGEAEREALLVALDALEYIARNNADRPYTSRTAHYTATQIRAALSRKETPQ